MTSKSSKGVKLSLGEFMGNGGVNSATASLPKGPAERAPDDDGSFKRPVRRDNNYMDQPPSRSEGDGNWRRGGGGTASSPAGFGSSGGGRSSYDSSDRSGGFDRGGAGGFDQRGGYSRGSYVEGGNNDSGTTRGDNWRGSNSTRESLVSAPSSSTGERPRLQLKSRTLPLPDTSSIAAQPIATPSEPIVEPKPSPGTSANVTPDSNKETAVVVDDKPVVEEKADVSMVEKTTPNNRVEAKEKVKREPDVINSRAAAFGGSSPSGNTRSEPSSARRDNQRSEQGPPPVLNSKFEKLADEERERKLEREGRRDRTSDNVEGPLPVLNSRFAAAALADRSPTKPDDRGPPPVVNSRFAAIAEADRMSSKPDDRGPPPVTNSRFAAAAEADRSSSRSDDRGPPPVMNSRFAAAAEADRSTSYSRNEDIGPPPIANSRFAAAAEADRSSNQYKDNADLGPPPVMNSRFAAAVEADGRSAYSRDDRGPPPVANSRFAAAAARADDEKMEFEDRRRERDNFYNRDAGQNQRVALPLNSRFAAAAAADSDYVDRDERERRFVNDRDRDGAGRDGRRAYDGGRYSRAIEEPPAPPVPTRVDELLKPKKQDEVVFVPLTKEHEANILKIPDKPLSKQEETFLVPSKKKTPESLPKVDVHDDPSVAIPSESVENILTSFSSGEKLGEELKSWCLERKLPPLEQLLFHTLKENEKLNPDPECGWAEPSKYGAALLTLVEDNLENQVQVLWAIQLYCESLGFPKLNGESVVQSMFRAMYKYDLAEADAFSLWKDDESESHEKGKMTAIVQTMEWFNWLEADDEEEGEDEEEDEEDVEY